MRYKSFSQLSKDVALSGTALPYQHFYQPVSCIGKNLVRIFRTGKTCMRHGISPSIIVH